MPAGSQTTTLVSRRKHDACAAAITRGLSVVRLPPRRSLSRWADENFYVSEETGEAGPWTTLPFQRAIMDCMGSRAIRILDFWKCTRIGYTKMLLALTAYNVAEMARSTGIYQPVQGDAEDFTRDEVDPLIRDVPILQERLDADPFKTTKNNKLDYKKFRGANLYIRGASTDRAFRRITLDTVIYDELESFERDVGDEGSAVKLGDNRISNATFPQSRRGSTPREAHNSLIAAEAEKARHMFYYFVPCPHCDHMQRLQFKQMRWDNDGDMDSRADSVVYECIADDCKETFDYSFIGLITTQDVGVWATIELERREGRDPVEHMGYTIECTDYDPILRDPDGKAVDWPRHIAFRIWSAYSPFFSWSDLVYEWLDAQDNWEDLKAVTNTRLGELWDELGETVEHNQIFQRREQYEQPPESVLVITAGVDVQDNRLEVNVDGWGRGFESWAIEHRVLYGDTETPGVWDDLDDVLAQTFETEDGRTLRIAAVGLDTGYLPDRGYLFASKSRHDRVYCMKGANDYAAPLTSPPSRQKVGKSGKSVDLFTVGVSVAKSILYKWLALKEPGPGYCHYPMSYDEEYFLQLTAEKKVTKRRRGFEVVEWLKERERNEALDMRNYSYLAAVILNPVWDALEGKEQTKKEAPKLPDREAEFVKERRQRRQRQKRRKGYVGRMGQ